MLQLGVTDVAASKQFYLDHGLTVAKSYGIGSDAGAFTDSDGFVWESPMD